MTLIFLLVIIISQRQLETKGNIHMLAFTFELINHLLHTHESLVER